MYESITVPTLVVDSTKVRRNASLMLDRAARNKAILRPHFKTHQARQVGRIFRELGVACGTVSSVTMAEYFADDGWDDLTVAFPVNLREMNAINALAGRIRLGLLVDNPDSVRGLVAGLRNPVDLWIKIDTGTHRCGLSPEEPDRVEALLAEAAGSPLIRTAGLLTHDSRTYALRGREAISALYHESATAMMELRATLAEKGFTGLGVSIGDTPSASLVEDWLGVDEVRAGNFAYYDLQQVGTGACQPESVAVAVACPVVGIYPERSEAVIYGGAVHLSKQSQPAMDGFLPGGPTGTNFGAVFRMEGEHWNGFLPGAWVRGVTQEHGMVRMQADDLSRLRVGDLLFICPVHSCLAAHALRENTHFIGF
ncbi:MAG: alanine racemase [Clostridia bacterium]|jgi:D-serine deaminase-like pyridoxal phosphate-dependent protein|nr:alanine racemase [Spirochaetia bacterium]